MLCAMVGLVVRAWPEGQPNCFINGTWSDPRGIEGLRIETRRMPEPYKPSEVVVVFYNTSSQLLKGAAPLRDLRVSAVEVWEGQLSSESHMLVLTCQNEALWVLQIPLGTSTQNMRVFTLPRAPIQKNQDDPQSSLYPSSTPSRHIVVNITLPKHNPVGFQHEDAVDSEASKEAKTEDNDAWDYIE
ncbi:hypothetical protein Pcinc_041415 [Petrolisthes cinctipes]|uniref:Uncharacterized protein n=1 Tax=Petrolisthes cinctipes TaxID=88211 RepID=A0AAE1BK76_PETCI|nr:hypothetical protein Pcinc_041415 [Petrolisthes cinctipes]